QSRRSRVIERRNAGERRASGSYHSVVFKGPTDSQNAHPTDADLIQQEHNTARFFVENLQISWILLIATFAAGIYGCTQMPKRKDPDIPVRVASVVTQWPGATSEQVEQLVTRPIESTIAENPNIRATMGGDFGIKSLSIPGLSII